MWLNCKIVMFTTFCVVLLPYALVAAFVGFLASVTQFGFLIGYEMMGHLFKDIDNAVSKRDCLTMSEALKKRKNKGA